MGSVIYDFLNESLLFSQSHQDNCYSSISEDDLQQELEKYRAYAVASIKDLTKEITSLKSQLKVFGAQDYFSIAHLMQTALYLDQVILPDPIFTFTAFRSDISNTMGQMIGVKPREGIDRQGLATASKQMKGLTPMIAANYIKFFPISYFMEPDERTPMGYSENGHSDTLPSPILSKYRGSAEVRSTMKTDQGLIVKDVLETGRGIAVQFKGDNDENINIYNLFEHEVIDMNEETKVVQFKMSLPDKPPSEGHFNAWVNQSINQSAIGHYEQLMKGVTSRAIRVILYRPV